MGQIEREREREAKHTTGTLNPKPLGFTSGQSPKSLLYHPQAIKTCWETLMGLLEPPQNCATSML